MKNQKHDIFISYSRSDKDKVYPLIEQINRSLGVECWIDTEGIESGAQFENVIIRAIDECKIVLFMLSDNSLASNWTKREVYYAENEGKRIVPVLVEGNRLRGWFQFHFGNIDFINIQSKEQKEKLIRDLKVWLEYKGPETVEKTPDSQQYQDNERKINEQKSTETVKEEKTSPVSVFNRHRKTILLLVFILIIALPLLLFIPVGGFICDAIMNNTPSTHIDTISDTTYYHSDDYIWYDSTAATYNYYRNDSTYW